MFGFYIKSWILRATRSAGSDIFWMVDIASFSFDRRKTKMMTETLLNSAGFCMWSVTCGLLFVEINKNNVTKNNE